MTGEGKMNPLISVVVPSYNYGHLILETLGNLQKQSFRNWECIIVDDGSTDNTRNVVSEWMKKDTRFRYLYQKNAGLSAARNTGINASAGEYIQLLDADDMLEPGKFTRQLSLFEKNPKASIVYGEVRYFTGENPAARFLTLDCTDSPWMKGSSSINHAALTMDLLAGNIFAVNAPLIKASVFKQIGYFDTDLRSVEDWDYWCRCAFAGVFFEFDPSPESFALVRTHPGSMSRNLATMMEASLLVRHKLAKLIRKMKDSESAGRLLEINFHQMAYLLKSLSDMYLKKGETYKGLKKLFRYALLKNEFRHFIKTFLWVFSGVNNKKTGPQ